jgi:hypothetical protein
MRLASVRTQRCQPSSSSAERNRSIWGIVQTKLRNRLALKKAEMMLVFIYQNLRTIRKVKDEPDWSPLLNAATANEDDDEEMADVDEHIVAALMQWWKETTEGDQGMEHEFGATAAAAASAAAGGASAAAGGMM